MPGAAAVSDMRRGLALAVVLALGPCPLLPTRPVRPIASPHLTAAAAASAFQLGAEAAALGVPISACPFTGEDAARAWRAGWTWYR